MADDRRSEGVADETQQKARKRPNPTNKETSTPVAWLRALTWRPPLGHNLPHTHPHLPRSQYNARLPLNHLSTPRISRMKRLRRICRSGEKFAAFNLKFDVRLGSHQLDSRGRRCVYGLGFSVLPVILLL